MTRESSFAFGDEGLVGTLCEPDAPAGARVALLLFNAGVVHRIGPHRINVRLARRLAAQGIPSLRFDLAANGDSPRSSSGRPFQEQAVADLRAAMDHVQRECGIARFVLFGFCSGGVHSYATAQADPRVAGILLYDTYLYPTWRTHARHYRQAIRRQGLFNAEGHWIWRRLRRGPAAAREPQAGAGLQISAGFRTPPPEEFAATLTALHQRGVATHQVMSGTFERKYNYARQFEDRFRPTGITAFVACDYMADMSHSATVMRTQQRFMERIEAFVLQVNARQHA